jgi:homoserine O-acetyltransferase
MDAMGNSKASGLVRKRSLELQLPEGGFELCSGAYLEEVVVAFETYGRLSPDRDNVVFVCHTLSGDAHAAGYHSSEDEKPGWWDPLIGPGRAVDTDKFHVICANILGGCMGTTGPGSLNPETGKPYGADFPLIEIKDAVRVHKLLLDQLDIPALYAVIGGSLGGMQALEWAIEYPDYVQRCVSIAAGTSLSPQALAFDIIARQEIENDPCFQHGQYQWTTRAPERGLAIARQIGHVTYLSSCSMARKFGRGEWPKSDVKVRGKFSTNFQVESYLHYQGDQFVARFDANSYLHLTRMMDMFDLDKAYGTLETAIEKIKAKVLVVSISTDWLFPPKQQRDLVSALLRSRKEVSFFTLDSPYGHDAFLIEYETLGRGIDAFLNGVAPSHAALKGSRLDVDQVSRMISAGDSLLDVGSGDGTFLASLKQAKRIRGICLDVDFDAVVNCMKKALPALQVDADMGLAMISDNAFDCVLLNQTIQQLGSALSTLKQMLRVAPVAVVGFPNFAFYRHRLTVGLLGRLPVSRTLPYAWYDTPNIHVITVKDFKSLCDRNALRIEQIAYISDDALGRRLTRLGLTNAGSERVLVKLRRSNSG